MVGRKKKEHKYKPHDRYVVINDNDPDLRPVVLKLPVPPRDKGKIHGYGLSPEKQRFAKEEIPGRLLALEKQAVINLEESARKHKNFAILPYKIQEEFWRLLEEKEDNFSAEIRYIRRMWWHRIHGYWFYNNGKPTYITGRNFFYLNFFKIDTDSGLSTPEYRDRDRKHFIYREYSYTTDETFERLDEEGYAIAELDGSYKMKSIGKRICYGVTQSKNRRCGSTFQGLSDGVEITSRTNFTDGMGIMSYSNDNAESHYADKLRPAYNALPIFFQPLTSTGQHESSIKFQRPKNDFTSEELAVSITYATTYDPKFYDGKKLICAFMDEEGKAKGFSVTDRWDVIKNCLSLGDGAKIFGITYHPSTVEEYAEGGAAYKVLTEQSNFYKRIASTGQTISGMFRQFIPATEGLEEFIDSYGYSIKDKLEEYQMAEGFTQSAYDYLIGQRDMFLKDASPESMKKHRNHKKLFPMQYSDSWLGGSGDVDFNMENIDKQMAEIRREDPERRGNLIWENGKRGDKVIWADDPINGKFSRTMLPPDGVRNKKVKIRQYSTFEDGEIEAWRPEHTDMFVLGADPFEFLNNSAASIAQKKTGSTSRGSKGGITVTWKRDKSIDPGDIMSEWKSFKPIMYYKHRPRNDDVYAEDVLKAAIFCGAMVYPETNKSSVYKKLIEWGYGGYLLFDVDPMTGKKKDKPGCYSLTASKDKLFSHLRNFVDLRCHHIGFMGLLKELKEINSMEEMTAYDGLTSFGLSLMGCDSIYGRRIEESGNSSNDVGDLMGYSWA